MDKFSRLITPFTGERLRDLIAATVQHLESHSVRDLTALLAAASGERDGAAGHAATHSTSASKEASHVPQQL